MASLVFTNATWTFNVLGVPALEAATSATRYVDYDEGDDDNDGLTINSAWKHDPEDPAATSVANAYTPTAGAVIGFKGGVRYRGHINLAADGALGNPIVRHGRVSGFGTGAAIFDGATPVTLVRAVVDQADAGGIANWADADLRIIEYAEPTAGTTIAFFDNTGLLHRNQYPVPANRYLYDDIQHSAGVTIEATVADYATTPTITNAELATECAGQEGQAEIGVWVEGSAMRYALVESVVGNVVTLASALDTAPYSPTKVFVRGTRKALATGTWANLDTGKAIVRLRGGDTAIRIGRTLSNGGGVNRFIRYAVADYVTFKGFRFEGFVGQPDASEAIIRGSGTASVGALFEYNTFAECTDDSGNMVCIQSTSLTGQTIRRNRFVNLSNFGAVLATSPNCTVEENVFSVIGRTAYRVTGNDTPASYNGICRRNIFTDLRGVHTNGLSLYNNHRDFLVEDNAIIDTPRPVTTQGDTAGASGRVFRGNLLTASTGDGNGWAWWHNGTANLAGMLLDDNVCIGWAAGILVKWQAADLTMTNNWSTNGTNGGGAGEYPGVAVDTSAGSDQRGSWAVSGAVAIASTYLADTGASIATDRCRWTRASGLIDLDLRGVGA